jgi:hypothetical protein
MNDFLLGAITMGFIVAGARFLRFWRDTHDGLFLKFALAFFVMGANRLAIWTSERPNEASPLNYLVRLCAYGLILWAIIDKNRNKPQAPPGA